MTTSSEQPAAPAYDAHRPAPFYSECGHVEPEDAAPAQEWDAYDTSHFGVGDGGPYSEFVTCEDGFSGYACVACTEANEGEPVEWPCAQGDPARPLPARLGFTRA